MLFFDVLIIGGGAAGLRAAIEAARMGANVAIASKAPIGYASSTLYAGGGFRAAFKNYSAERHFEETIIGGAFLNDQELVRTLVLEGKNRILELKSLGVDLKIRPGGAFIEGPPLMTCINLVNPLAKYASNLNVKFIEGVMAIDLIVNGKVNGAILYDLNSNKLRLIQAKSIVIATGGYSQLFLRNDNPVRITGDGCVMALKAGASLIDMEFIQFFPLGLAEEKMPTWLFPAVYGKLVNSIGEDVLEKYNIKVPLHVAAIMHRDLLSRIIYKEISEGRGVNEALIIKLARPSETEESKVLTSIATSLANKLHISSNNIKVAPLAHFTMGGIEINTNCETSIPGLFACGEVTGGIHGANRLGGNALTEAIVFGARAGISAAKYAKNTKLESLDEKVIHKYEEKLSSLRNGNINPKNLKYEVKKAMWKYCGVIRNKNKLNELIKIIDELKNKLDDVYAEKTYQILEALELQNMIQLSEIVAKAALERNESRGAHYREDYPEMDNRNWLKRIVFKLKEDKIIIEYKPVELKYLALRA